MNPTDHPDERRLILHLCGEDDPDLPSHLAGCERCRAEQSELREVLALVDAVPVPGRGERYGEEVWRRLRTRIEKRRTPAIPWQGLFAPRGWAIAATAAALALVGFLAGRHWPVPPSPIPAPARERILLVAVGDHLERASAMLVELMNSGGAEGSMENAELAGAQQRAEDLVAANRIYRRTAAGAGDLSTAAVLEELERVLLDIAHRPAPLDAVAMEQIRRGIEERGILFKVKIIGSQVREREKETAREKDGTPAGGRT